MAECAGLDVSKEATSFCVKDAAGKVLAEGKAIPLTWLQDGHMTFRHCARYLGRPTAQEHYDEASGQAPETTSQTTVLPAKDKRFGRA